MSNQLQLVSIYFYAFKFGVNSSFEFLKIDSEYLIGLLSSITKFRRCKWWISSSIFNAYAVVKAGVELKYYG